MPAFTYHLFVCGNQRRCDHPRGCCDPDGKNDLRNQLKAAFQAKNAGPLVRVNSAGCLDQCEFGPTLVIYPQGIWYGRIQPDDIPRIVDSVLQGTILDDLLLSESDLNSKSR